MKQMVKPVFKVVLCVGISCMFYGCGNDKFPGTRIEKSKMVFVEGGTFTMGFTPEQTPFNKQPGLLRETTVGDFYMCSTEVTVSEYMEFIKATGYNNGVYTVYYPGGDKEASNNDYPANVVSKKDAEAYCRWAGVELPTEEEWEYAARGGNKSKGYRYAGTTEEPDEYAWYGKDYRTGNPSHVATKKPNELGLYDMSGNVWEWCAGYLDVNGKPSLSPPSHGRDIGVLRGGAYNSPKLHIEVSRREFVGANYSDSEYGFRVCKRIR